ncbi:ImmA/IrrE family metallo-endopeptidase [Ureibacillus thermophilus]|uniref:ImmA/IrrE family metallo-endopeptidase n=1 Tax=Ureibacillus thermophilus TaxID=367743 RepID=A0A4P6UQZ2_9BACL|nr:ImmA/IrrE family metallo-endopeptidase [Ureibacillus thermophilus]QBK24967.1 ImmA/IrrE family metallo-endopeptidase [Ureibacillus thermophilus]
MAKNCCISNNTKVSIALNAKDKISFVCAHELGHAVLHHDANTPFLKRKTLFSTERIEIEANKFAVELLMPDDFMREYSHLTIYEIAMMANVPREVVHLKRFNNLYLQ